MIIAIIGAFLNVILDYILVYGITGFIPAMNIEGAAYASVIAQITMAVIALVLLMKRTKISLKLGKTFHEEIPRLLGMIGNLFIRTIALNIALYFATSYATDYGANFIAAYTIAVNIWLLGAFMVDGYSSAGNILSGKLLGAKEYTTLVELSKKLFIYGIVVGSIIALFGFAFYNFIGEVFTNENAVLEQFNKVFWIVLAMLSTGLVFIPTLLFFDWLDYKLIAIWIAFTLWILARGIPLVVKFRRTFLPLLKS
jgi:Na+-driven multidrug efflux pump